MITSNLVSQRDRDFPLKFDMSLIIEISDKILYLQLILALIPTVCTHLIVKFVIHCRNDISYHLAIVIIRPTCRDVLWYGAGVCLSVCLSTKLVITIQTEPFQLGPSNLVHLQLMTRGRTLLIFKVRGQRSRSHVTHCC